jgi:hypothetical protein
VPIICASLASIILHLLGCYGCCDVLLLLCCMFDCEVLRDYCIPLSCTFSSSFSFLKKNKSSVAITLLFITCTWTPSVIFFSNYVCSQPITASFSLSVTFNFHIVQKSYDLVYILRRHVASGKLLRITSQFLLYLRLLIHGKTCRLEVSENWRRICFHLSVKTSRKIYVPRSLHYQEFLSSW